MDMQLFLKNRQQFPPEELAKYEGKYVAWSPDGASILATDEDELRLDKTIEAAGYDSAEILIAFVPPGDEIILGGGLEVVE
jgi:hypothetical protein